MWKNKHEAVSAKKPKQKLKAKVVENRTAGSAGSDVGDEEAEVVQSGNEWNGEEHQYTKNDKVLWGGQLWICRKSHTSKAERPPDQDYSSWKESD